MGLQYYDKHWERIRIKRTIKSKIKSWGLQHYDRCYVQPGTESFGR